ncbi:MAG TPA: type II secretion system F family protein [Mycobacteriales bacterium]|nr:type II secretion system F family protein [Mycobacteriales bacterium]
MVEEARASGGAAVNGVFAALAVALAVATARPARRSGHRLARLTASPAPPTGRSRPSGQAVWVVAAAAVLLAGVTLGPWAGACAGAVAVLLGRGRAEVVPPLDVPLVADLIAACLAAGATPAAALRAAAESSPAAAAACRPVADLLAAGVAPELAWADWLARSELATVARACVRAADSGAATTLELRRAGDRARSQRRAELARRAHRAGVWAVLPLGLCFLPAFVLVGIVPFALGLLGR